MKTIATSFAAGAALACAWAQAQTVPAPPEASPPTQVQSAPTPTPTPPPAARWTAAQIRQAFDMADRDSNGELSRAESQRLAILPRSFEDMDENKDGVLVRSEYEAAFPR